MSKGHYLQDPFLSFLRAKEVHVSIFLVNGIKLRGRVEAFDQFVLVLKNSVSQMIYKHAISTVVPDCQVPLPSFASTEGDADLLAAEEPAPPLTQGDAQADDPIG